MRNFYLAWPVERIDQTVSDKSSVLGILQTVSGPFESSRISRTPSAMAADPPNPETVTRNSFDLAALAKAFPLPWSAYVRLLSVKNELVRDFYETEALRCGWSVRQLDRQINS